MHKKKNVQSTIFPLRVSLLDGIYLWDLECTTCPKCQKKRRLFPTAYNARSNGGVLQPSQTEVNSGFLLLSLLEMHKMNNYTVVH